jgi:hypothetical protein
VRAPEAGTADGVRIGTALRAPASTPALLAHGRLPRFAGDQHVILRTEDLRALELTVDLQSDLLSEVVCPELTDGAQSLVVAGLADAKQVAEQCGLPIPVLALQGGGHRGGIVARTGHDANAPSPKHEIGA